MSDNTSPVPADDDAVAQAMLADLADVTGVDSITFGVDAPVDVVDAGAVVLYATPVKVDGKQAKQAGRRFTKIDYIKTAAHLYRMAMHANFYGADAHVAAIRDAYAAMFSADSAAHPVAGYPAFDVDRFTALCDGIVS